MEQETRHLTVADIVAMDALGLEVCVGAAALGNAVEVAHVSEAPNAPDWLEGGEFLITSGALLADADWNDYVAVVAERGAAALALGIGASATYDAVPSGLVQAGEQFGIPVLAIPEDTPFIAVTKAIFDARAEIDRHVAELSAELQRELTRVAARGRGLGGLIHAWRQFTGEEAILMDRRARILTSTLEVPAGTAAIISDLAVTLPPLTTDLAPVDTPLGRAHVVPIGATRHAGYLARLHSSLHSADVALPTLTSLLALEFERRWLLDEPQRRARANHLARLLAAEDDVRASGQLKALGVTTDEVRAIAIEASTEDQAEEILADLAIALDTGLVRRKERLVEAVASSDPRGTIAAFGLAVPIGIGQSVSPGLAARSLRQAHSALATSRRTGSVVEYVDGASHEFLLAVADATYLASFADAVLSPLEEADGTGALVDTLHAWLAEQRSIADCATRLGVHRHTVRNRIQRATQLLGRSLDDVETQTELWLALKARGTRDLT